MMSGLRLSGGRPRRYWRRLNLNDIQTRLVMVLDHESATKTRGTAYRDIDRRGVIVGFRKKMY
jgi:hypothetical protein